MSTGQDIREQAADNGFLNTEPLVAKSVVVGIVGPILVILAAFGFVTEDQRTLILEQVGVITVAVVVMAPTIASILTAVWGRLSTFSPRTAAGIALANLKRAPGAEPTLNPVPPQLVETKV